MADLTLDTSGGVGPMPGWYKPVPTSNRFIFWADLSPFAQGYVEALFADWQHRACVLPYVKGRGWPDFEVSERHDFPLAFTDAAGHRWDIVRHHGQWKRTICQTPGEFPGFSDLSPEALALILKDCEVYERHYPMKPFAEYRRARGAAFWAERNSGKRTSDWSPVHFYPQTVSLGDDGKVYLKESAS